MSFLTHKRLIEPIHLHLPESYLAASNTLESLQKDNPNIRLRVTEKRSLEILEHRFSFYEHASFPVKLPGLTYSIFTEIHDLNQELTLEFSDCEEVRINMAVIRIISKITAAIISSFYVWAKKYQTGEVYSENGEYDLAHPSEKGKRIRKIPDVSFISYQKSIVI